MAKVNLIEYTGKGREDEQRHAANLLVFTKNTRLNMTPDGFERIQAMDESELAAELDYMAGTIPSSWEFVDLTFSIQGVSRACAQQITRTRTASYAMQSQRVTDLREVGVVNPYDANSEEGQGFERRAERILKEYAAMVQGGAAPQDARGLLPMNVECNLLAKYNLRAFVDLIKARRSLRVQGEYSDIADQMFAAVIEVWPWAEAFFKSPHDRAIEMLEGVAADIGVTTGKGAGWQVAKAIDLLRKG